MTNKKQKQEKKVEQDQENKEEVKEEVEENSSKRIQKIERIYASFWQRLCAFIIDMFLITLVSSLITSPFVKSDNLDKLSEETYHTIEQYTNGKLDVNTYINRTMDISYDMARESGLSSIISIAIAILYFVVYQFKCGGQTLGKKFMKIQIVKKEGQPLTMNDLLFRALVINSILFNIIALCFSIFANKDVYFYGVGIFQFIQYVVIFISCLMILSRKDRQGLHDMIVNTEVVIV